MSNTVSRVDELISIIDDTLVANNASFDDSKSTELSEEFVAWAVLEQNGKFVQYKYKPLPLGENDVQILITHNGICHSDLAMARNNWGWTQYPFIGGHECIGIIEKLGKTILLKNKQNITLII